MRTERSNQVRDKEFVTNCCATLILSLSAMKAAQMNPSSFFTTHIATAVHPSMPAVGPVLWWCLTDEFPSDIQDQVTTTKDDLLSVQGVLHKYFVANPITTPSDVLQSWIAAYSNLPFFGPADKTSGAGFVSTIKSVSQLANELQQCVLGSSKGADASLASYLTKLGAVIQKDFGGMHNNSSTFVVSAITLEWNPTTSTFVPMLKLYYFTLDAATLNSIADLCAHHKEVKVNLTYSYDAMLFNYKSLTDSEQRKKFEQFLQEAGTTPVESLPTYYTNTK